MAANVTSDCVRVEIGGSGVMMRMRVSESACVRK
jgi:hypothetical protein